MSVYVRAALDSTIVQYWITNSLFTNQSLPWEAVLADYDADHSILIAIICLYQQ